MLLENYFNENYATFHQNNRIFLFLSLSLYNFLFRIFFFSLFCYFHFLDIHIFFFLFRIHVEFHTNLCKKKSSFYQILIVIWWSIFAREFQGYWGQHSRLLLINIPFSTHNFFIIFPLREKNCFLFRLSLNEI